MYVLTVTVFFKSTEMFYKDFSLAVVFGNLIEELTKLATDGISVNIDSTEQKVFLVCGAFLGKKMLLKTNY